MKHVVTMRHEVEAEDWSLAVEAVLRQPTCHLSECTIKSPGKKLIHAPMGPILHAAQQIREGA